MRIKITFTFFLLQELKVKVLEQVQDQLNCLLDKALIENVPPFNQKQPAANGTTHPSSRSGGGHSYCHYHCCLLRCIFLLLTPLKCLCPLWCHSRSQRMDDGKVFMARPSVLEWVGRKTWNMNIILKAVARNIQLYVIFMTEMTCCCVYL